MNILLKVSTDAPDPSYQDGDIVVARNLRATLCCHAQEICHHWKEPPSSDGLRPNAMARQYFELTSEFRFERVSRKEVRRVKIATGAADILSDVPNAAGEYMDVALFVARRMQEQAPDNGGPRLAMFGTKGAEIWYGGNTDHSEPKVQQVWDMIEGSTAKRRANHKLWPFTNHECRLFLPIAVDNFDDATAVDLESSEIDNANPDNPVMLQRRMRFVDWKKLLGRMNKTRAQVKDRSIAVDARDVQFDRSQVVATKTKKK